MNIYLSVNLFSASIEKMSLAISPPRNGAPRNNVRFPGSK